MNKISSYTNNYISEIRKGLPSNSKSSKKLIEDLSLSIRDFMLDHPDCSYDELIDVIGSPDDIIEEYKSNINISPNSLRYDILIAILILIVLGGASISSIIHTKRLYESNYLYDNKTIEISSGITAVANIDETIISTDSNGLTTKEACLTISYIDDHNTSLYTNCLTATFQYNGKECECIAMNTTIPYSCSNWKVKCTNQDLNQNNCSATYLAKHYSANTVVNTLESEISIYCDNNGNLLYK